MKFLSSKNGPESAQARGGFLRHQIAAAISNQAKYLCFYRCLGSQTGNEENQFRRGTFVPERLKLIPGYVRFPALRTPDDRDAFKTARAVARSGSRRDGPPQGAALSDADVRRGSAAEVITFADGMRIVSPEY